MNYSVLYYKKKEYIQPRESDLIFRPRGIIAVAPVVAPGLQTG